MSLISQTIWICFFFVLYFFWLSLDGIDLNAYIVEHKILVVIKISANVRVYQDFVNYVYLATQPAMECVSSYSRAGRRGQSLPNVLYPLLLTLSLISHIHLPFTGHDIEGVKINDSKNCTSTCVGLIRQGSSSCLCVAVKRTVQIYELTRTRLRHRYVSVSVR